MTVPAKGRVEPFSSKKDKLEANYRNAEKCSMCDFYMNGKCESVEGNISLDAVCDLWQIRSRRTGGLDAAFYQDEYNKRK